METETNIHRQQQTKQNKIKYTMSDDEDEEYIPQNDADFTKLTTEDAQDGDFYILGTKQSNKRKLNNNNNTIGNSVLDEIKQRKRARKEKEQNDSVDSLWTSMNETSGSSKLDPLAALNTANRKKKKKKKKDKKNNDKKKKKIKLSNLLRGMSSNNNNTSALVSSSILSSSNSSSSTTTTTTTTKKKNHQAISQAALAAAKAAKSMEKVTVKEVVKFANQVTEITRTVEAGTEAANSRNNNDKINNKNNKVNALDMIIDGLKGPNTVSTVEKTSFDWENYKNEHGITEDVEKYTKNGYLTKQDFLNRVDLRQFEMEKKERERQRTKRDAELARSKKRR